MKEEPTEPDAHSIRRRFYREGANRQRGMTTRLVPREPGHVNTILLPRRYRPRSDDTRHNENKLLQAFRMRARKVNNTAWPHPKSPSHLIECLS